MATSAGAARCPDGPQLLIHVGGRTRRLRVAEPFEHAQGVTTFAVAESAGTRGVVGDRFTHDVALGLAETGGRLPNLRDCPLVQRERDSCHNVAIMP